MAILEASMFRQTFGNLDRVLAFLATLQLSRNIYPEEPCIYDGESYDYIVVGGGTAGCVVASRLVEDKKTSVLLIEAGGDPKLESDLPGILNYAGSTDETWRFQVEDPGLNLNSINKPHADIVSGKVLGGSSSMNFLQYSSGSKHDYNEWAQIVNDTNWNWENVLPYLKKSQRLEVPSILKNGAEFYGRDGAIVLTEYLATANLDTKPYLKMYEEAGHSIYPSINGNISIGFTNGLYSVGSTNGRQNTAMSYLIPKLNYPNLHIVRHTIATKIIFNTNKRAVGVKALICNSRYVIIKARREVILSAGTVNTPKLLMLSGVGPKEHLCKHKIKTISDIPVGTNFQDQRTVLIGINMTNTVKHYRPMNPYDFPVINIMGFVSLNKSVDYPDYQSCNYMSQTNIMMQYCVIPFNYNNIVCNNLYSTSMNSFVMFILINKQRFKSRGRILLRSSKFEDEPIIYSNYYSVPEDLESHAKYVLDNIRIQESKTFKKLGGQIKDPGLSECGKMDSNSLEYWKCYIQYMSTTQHKNCGTCALGTVVDSHLRVYGVKNLRVADCSIMPNIPLGGTMGPVIMIGEKAADFIKEDRNK